MTYVTRFGDQPIGSFDSWAEAAADLIKRGLATFAFNCIFTLLPGVTLKPLGR